MAANYIPRPDGDFWAWQANFITYANAHLADLGITPNDMAPITAPQGLEADIVRALEIPRPA